MFALEIIFHDGVSVPETVLVRRPYALLGSSTQAHVAIDDMAELGYQLAFIRELGRTFRVKPLSISEGAQIPQQLEGIFDGHRRIELDTLTLNVYALDGDLALRESEPPDRAGVRVLRQSATFATAIFPAIAVRGEEAVVVSFAPDQPVFVGRSNQCLVRIDSDEISSKHARIGFESGEFWIEDLGSSNGTFVDGQQISGRTALAPGTPVLLGRHTTILGISSKDNMEVASSFDSSYLKRPSTKRYPVLVSASEIARPARVVLTAGGTFSIGRDPANEMWLGAPHVSRTHCDVSLTKGGRVIVQDHSTNGTYYGTGVLQNGEQLELNSRPHVLNFGGDITVAVCFTEEEEQEFLSSAGDPAVFLPAADDTIEGERDVTLGSKSQLEDSLVFDEVIETMPPTTQGTVAFKNMVLHLTWPAKIMLTIGVAGAFVLVWAIVSLLLTF